MRSKLFLLAIIAWALASLPAVAQETTRVEARVKFLSMTRPLIEVGLLQGTKAEGLAIATDMLTDEIVYRGASRLELLDEVKGSKKAAPSAGVKARLATKTFKPAGTPPIAWIDLPTNQGRLQLILLVTPGLGNGIVALNDSPGSAPLGSNRYLNLCSFPIVVRLPSGDHVIGPKGSKTARPGAKDSEYYDLQILTKTDVPDKLAFSGRVFHMNSVRKLYLISEAPGESQRITLKVVEDRDAPAKALPPSAAPPK